MTKRDKGSVGIQGLEFAGQVIVELGGGGCTVNHMRRDMGIVRVG